MHVGGPEDRAPGGQGHLENASKQGRQQVNEGGTDEPATESGQGAKPSAVADSLDLAKMSGRVRLKR